MKNPFQNAYQWWAGRKLNQFVDAYNTAKGLNEGANGFLENNAESISQNWRAIRDYYRDADTLKAGRTQSVKGFFNPVYQYFGMNFQKQREFAEGLAQYAETITGANADGNNAYADKDIFRTSMADLFGHSMSKGATAALRNFAAMDYNFNNTTNRITASDFMESGERRFAGVSVYWDNDDHFAKNLIRNMTVSSEISSAAIDATSLVAGLGAYAAFKGKYGAAAAGESYLGNGLAAQLGVGLATGTITRLALQKANQYIKNKSLEAKIAGKENSHYGWEFISSALSLSAVGGAIYGASQISAEASPQTVSGKDATFMAGSDVSSSAIAGDPSVAGPVDVTTPIATPTATPTQTPSLEAKVADTASDSAGDAGSAINLYDQDGDGYLNFPFGYDCDDTNSLVHPGAEEISGNFIDDNCDGFIDTNAPGHPDTIPGPYNPSDPADTTAPADAPSAGTPAAVPDAPVEAPVIKAVDPNADPLPAQAGPDDVPAGLSGRVDESALASACTYNMTNHQWQDSETGLDVDYRTVKDNLWYGIRDVNVTQDSGLAVHLNKALAAEADYVRILVDSNGDGKIGAGDSSFFVEIKDGYATLDHTLAQYDWANTRFQVGAVDTDGLSINDCQLEGRMTYLSSVDSKGLDLSTGYLKPAPAAPVTAASVAQITHTGDTVQPVEPVQPVGPELPESYAPQVPVFNPDLIPENLIIVNNFDECQTLDGLYSGPGELRVLSMEEVPELTRIANLGIADRAFMTMAPFAAPDDASYPANWSPWQLSTAQHGDNLTHVYFMQAQVVDGDSFDNVSFLFQAKDSAPNDMLGMEWDRGFWMNGKDLGFNVEELTLNKNDLFRVYTQGERADFANVFQVSHVGDDWQQHELTPLDVEPLKGDVKEQVGDFKDYEKFRLSDKHETGDLENILGHKVKVGFNRTGGNSYMIAGYDMWDENPNLVRDLDFIMVNGGRSEPEVVFTAGMLAGAGLTGLWNWLGSSSKSAAAEPFRSGGPGIPSGGGGAPR